MDITQLEEKERSLASAVRQKSERIWEADTPREALAWLRVHLDWPATVAAFVKVDGGTEVRLAQKVFFRGHSDASWSLRPTLLRVDQTSRSQADRAAQIMSKVTDLLFSTLWSADGAQTWPPLYHNAGYAAAQHYGMKTTLLDWTVNPSVAIDFATREQKRSQRQRAAVYWMSSGVATELGLKIVLPPPYVVRLYIQRGFFTELNEEQVLDLSEVCSRVEFPPSPHLKTETIDEAYQIKGLTIDPEDEWFKSLAEWSIQRAAKESDTRDLDPVLLSLEFNTYHRKNHPAVDALSDISLFMSDEFLKIALAYINQLAYRHTKEGGCYDPRVLRILRRDNPDFFAWVKEAGIELKECY